MIEHELPEGWQLTSVNKICIVERGSSPRPIEKYITTSEGINWIKIGDTKNATKYLNSTKEKITYDGAKKSRAVKAGDLILSNSMSFGKPYIMKIDGCIHDGWFVLRLNESIDTEYLYYTFISPYVSSQINRLATGSVVRNISSDVIKTVNLVLPPLPIQKQIVAKIEQLFSELDSGVSILQTLKSQVKLYRQSILKAAFFGKLTGSYVNDDKLPQGWQLTSINKICIVERGSSPRPIEKYITNAEGINWIKIGDTKNATKYLNSTKEKITYDGAKRSRFVKAGDLILSNSMSFGKPYIMKTEGCIHDGWFVLRLNETIDTEYLYYCFLSPYVSEQINRLATGSVVRNISSDIIKTVNLALPPLQVQKQIVTKIEELFAICDELDQTITNALNQSQLLRQTILKQAFSGKLI